MHGLQAATTAAGWLRPHPLQLRPVEEQGRRSELVHDEHHHPDEEDEELHRDLEQAVHQQASPTLGERTSGQIPLHLRLVGAEVRELYEEPAQQPRPERVPCVEPQRRVHPLELPQRPGQRDAFPEGEPRRKQRDSHPEGDQQAHEDDRHLRALGAADRAASSGDRVDDSYGTEGQLVHSTGHPSTAERTSAGA